MAHGRGSIHMITAGQHHPVPQRFDLIPPTHMFDTDRCAEEHKLNFPHLEPLSKNPQSIILSSQKFNLKISKTAFIPCTSPLTGVFTGQFQIQLTHDFICWMHGCCWFECKAWPKPVGVCILSGPCSGVSML